MTGVLVVEDDANWQRIHKGRLEHLLGEKSVRVTDNFDDAIFMLNQSYAAYVLDGEFPRHKGGNPEPLGLQLAQEIYQREQSYDKIAIVSGNSSVLREALKLGINKIYSKGLPNKETGERDLLKLADDLRPLLATKS